jgi:hypothetical protein
MNRKRLKLGLPLLCATGLAAAALHSYTAGAFQREPPRAGVDFGIPVPVDCSDARGVEGRDFHRDPSRSSCSMAQASFRRLYPEIAQLIDEVIWE